MGKRLNLIAAVALSLFAGADAAGAQENRPTILLLDGLFIYVHQAYVGVSDLAPRLNAMGYRAVVDTHLMNRTAREEPAVIVGHSMGGSAALRFAREMKESGRPPPVVITIDAAFGSPSCAVPRCINFRSPGFPAIEGAENVDAWQNGAYMVNHAMLATNAAVQRLVLREAEAVLAARNATGAPLTAPVPIPRPN
jgi:pimeloyl-ACP methyl ester carboxylesterase